MSAWLPQWCFGAPKETGARIQREYAAWLQEQLPDLPPHHRRTPTLVDAYRTLTDLKVEASRRHLAATSANLDTARIQQLGRRAQELHAAWEVLHRHMVALEYRELTGGMSTSDEVAMVLLAESLVESLVLGVGDRP